MLPDQSVHVSAPLEASEEDILRRVGRRARWILKQQRFFSEHHPAARSKEYVSGETLHYLGRQYRLKVIDLQDIALSPAYSDESVRLARPYLRVYTRRPGDPLHIRRRVEQWYREKAERKFVERLRICSDRMGKYGVVEPPVQLRKMEKRWGSCAPSGRILLNPRLVETPTYCIDYVTFHELCHLKHPHHGAAFYQLLTAALPEWREIKRRLERIQL